MGLGAAWGTEKADEMIREAGFKEVVQGASVINGVQVMFICKK